MKVQAALNHIRQLCCLGLDSEAIMPALMQAVHDYIPSYQNIFFWVGDDGQFTNIYDENMQNNLKIAQLHFEEFYNAKEKAFWPGGLALVRSNQEFVNLSRYMTKQGMRTDYYNEIVRGMGAHYIIFAKAQEQGRCTGVLGLYRSVKDKPFTSQEERNLRAIMPYIEHCMHTPAVKPATYADAGEQGLVIMDQNGQVCHLCPVAHRLLFWASHAQFTPQRLSHVRAKPAPPALQQLCQNLIAVFQGQGTQAPVLIHSDAWGRFTLRGYWLDPYEHSASSLIGITVQRQEPAALGIVRQMQNLPLSPRLKDVCLLFAQGHTQHQIAKHLHISDHTVTDYVRTLYDKLGVHNREGLLNTLKAQQTY